jgi:hypothetical protein
MKRRGHSMLLVLIALSAASIAGAVFCTRLSLDFNARAGDALRLQTLWLARSACSAQLVGARQVRTAQGLALVTRSGDVAKVELAKSSAVIDCTTHEERYRTD